MKTIHDYTVYCTTEQTKKAFELGAPIEILPNYIEYRIFPLVKCKDGNERPCFLPTAEQMIGWLEEQDIFININHTSSGYSSWLKTINKNKYISENLGYVSTHKEATIAAIDAALEYLEKQKIS